MKRTTTILDKILATKRDELVRARQERPESQLRDALANAPAPRDFLAPLARQGSLSLIAEVKKASPSQGVIRQDFDPVAIAKIYERHGASCISVLTDQAYFQGDLRYLAEIREQVDLPLLRKDFIIDSYQLLEARVHGADAVLLIAECLDDCLLRKLHNECLELGMTPLVELYEETNVSRVLEAGATLIGVNNRDLRTFEVDLQHTVLLRSKIPDDCTLVAESGIRSRADVLQLEQAGVDAMLVGQSLMEQPDIGTAVDALLGNNSQAS